MIISKWKREKPPSVFQVVFIFGTTVAETTRSLPVPLGAAATNNTNKFPQSGFIFPGAFTSGGRKKTPQ